MRFSIAWIFMIFTPFSLSGWATLGLKYNFFVILRGTFRGTKFLTRMLIAQPKFYGEIFLQFGPKIFFQILRPFVRVSEDFFEFLFFRY